MTNASARTIYTSRRGTAYQRRGTGPVLVLVHGWCLSRQIWMYQEEALADSFTVVSPDLAGFGESAGLAGPYEASRHAEDLADLVDELNATSAIIVGFAYGAVVATELASKSPGVVNRAVLIGLPSAATAPYDRMPKAMRRDWPEFARRSARGICADGTSEATLDWLTRIFVDTPLPVALAVVEELGGWEPVPAVESVRTRTLLVHGTADTIVPLEVSEAAAQRMPAARVEPIEGSGHLVPMDAKERLSQLIADFAGEAP